jgi:hypothetical protein
MRGSRWTRAATMSRTASKAYGTSDDGGSTTMHEAISNRETADSAYTNVASNPDNRSIS